MKFSHIALAVVASATSVFALPEPVAVAAPAPAASFASHAPAARELTKRAVNAVVQVDGLRYRRCPRVSCDAVGQYAKGTRIQLECWAKGDVVEGDGGWGRMPNGFFVALAYGKYVSWEGGIYQC